MVLSTYPTKNNRIMTIPKTSCQKCKKKNVNIWIANYCEKCLIILCSKCGESHKHFCDNWYKSKDFYEKHKHIKPIVEELKRIGVIQRK